MDVTDYFWLIEPAMGLFGILCFYVALKKIAFYVQENKAWVPSDWRKELVHIVSPPLRFLFVVLGIVYAIDALAHNKFVIAVSYIHAFRRATIVIGLVWLFFRWKEAFQKALAHKDGHGVDVMTVEMIGRLVTVFVGILSFLVLLQIFEINIGPLLAFGSVGAASIGFASKDVIANFCSGLMLQITQPFVIGDYILLPEKNLQGNIEEIKWFRTLIRDKDKQSVYLPNSLFTTLLVINGSRISHHRFKQMLHISFADVDKIGTLTAKIKKMLLADKRVDNNLSVHVYFQSAGQNSLNIEIEAFCFPEAKDLFNQTQQDLLLKIQKELLLENIKLQGPQMYVTMASEENT